LAVVAKRLQQLQKSPDPLGLISDAAEMTQIIILREHSFTVDAQVFSFFLAFLESDLEKG
jgi:hypothetical protein